MKHMKLPPGLKPVSDRMQFLEERIAILKDELKQAVIAAARQANIIRIQDKLIAGQQAMIDAFKEARDDRLN